MCVNMRVYNTTTAQQQTINPLLHWCQLRVRVCLHRGPKPHVMLCLTALNAISLMPCWALSTQPCPLVPLRPWRCRPSAEREPAASRIVRVRHNTAQYSKSTHQTGRVKARRHITPQHNIAECIIKFSKKHKNAIGTSRTFAILLAISSIICDFCLRAFSERKSKGAERNGRIGTGIDIGMTSCIHHSTSQTCNIDLVSSLSHLTTTTTMNRNHDYHHYNINNRINTSPSREP